MGSFADYMMSIYVQYNLILAVIMLIVGFGTANRLPLGLIPGIIGFFSSIVAAVMIVSVAILVMAAARGAAIKAEYRSLQWALESGPEFALLPMLLCPIAFVIGRLRRKRIVSR
ncbi:hypothetical protein [Mesorhizobium sp.]|uniref:hypothetical protein n=1 Tax=Mesorhizobium sp. TaxID=1871066 RepID=UPI000FE60A3A|nr:hypothetical protein [Mesorhizobium sp.]RWO20073.1 MAG: hypothetical protein EOS09_28665 [Mesorhizobium sp.]